MLDAAAILMRDLHERSMTELVKRSGGNGGLFVIFLIFNVTLCLPFLLFVRPHPTHLRALTDPASSFTPSLKSFLL